MDWKDLVAALEEARRMGWKDLVAALEEAQRMVWKDLVAALEATLRASPAGMSPAKVAAAASFFKGGVGAAYLSAAWADGAGVEPRFPGRGESTNSADYSAGFLARDIASFTPAAARRALVRAGGKFAGPAAVDFDAGAGAVLARLVLDRAGWCARVGPRFYRTFRVGARRWDAGRQLAAEDWFGRYGPLGEGLIRVIVGPAPGGLDPADVWQGFVARQLAKARLAAQARARGLRPGDPFPPVPDALTEFAREHRLRAYAPKTGLLVNYDPAKSPFWEFLKVCLRSYITDCLRRASVVAPTLSWAEAAPLLPFFRRGLTAPLDIAVVESVLPHFAGGAALRRARRLVGSGLGVSLTAVLASERWVRRAVIFLALCVIGVPAGRLTKEQLRVLVLTVQGNAFDQVASAMGIGAAGVRKLHAECNDVLQKGMPRVGFALPDNEI